MGTETINPYIAHLEGIKIPFMSAEADKAITQQGKPFYQPNQNPGFQYPNTIQEGQVMNPAQPPAASPTGFSYPNSIEEGKVIVPAQAQAKTPQELVSSITGPAPEFPKPVYDKARQDRNRQLSKLQAFGDVFKTMGDVFSLSKGANVIPRGPNEDVRALYANWQNYDDNYQTRMDEYNRGKFNADLEQLRYGDSKAWREKVFGAQQEEQKLNREERKVERDYEKEYRDRSYKLQLDQFEQQQNNWDKNFLQGQKQFASTMGLHYAQLDLSRQKALYDLQSDMLLYKQRIQALDKDNFYLLDDKGNKLGKVNIKNGELDKAFAILMKDPNVSQEIDALETAMGGKITASNQQYLLAKYGPDNPGVMKMLGYTPPDQYQNMNWSWPPQQQQAEPVQIPLRRGNEPTPATAQPAQQATKSPFEF